VQTRDNIIWIFGDQHRAQALGCAGDPNIHTPNIDRLASEGLWLKNAVCNTPLCTPSRGGLITGRHAVNAAPAHQDLLDPNLPTIADHFKSAGWHTAWFGKWHLDGFKEGSTRASHHITPPERRGRFDTWVGYENNNSQWDSWVHGGEGDSAFHRRLPGYETDALTDLFIQHIREQGESESPFFAVLSVQPPHDPYVAPEEFMGRHTPGGIELSANVPSVERVQERASREYAGYAAMVENLDWNVGRIRAALEEAGLSHNTHIIFFSDHGDMLGSHGMFRKTTPHEESIRVPMIIGGHVPLYEHRTAALDCPFSLVDLAPTSLGLCGIEVPEGMEGNDWSCLRRHNGDPTGPDAALISLPAPTGHGDSIDRPWRGVVTADGWKYAALEGQPWLLFNLNEDPYEQVNLALNPGFKEKRAELQARLKELLDDAGDDFSLPEN
jgi:arylsulfatase A-like enzyme